MLLFYITLSDLHALYFHALNTKAIHQLSGEKHIYRVERGATAAEAHLGALELEAYAGFVKALSLQSSKIRFS
jgi:hypothetical protein